MAAHPFDIHVGNKIRIARLEGKISQTELAERLQITFQQVQKYEKGTNRTSCSRLYDISNSLKRPLAYFMEGYDENGYTWGEIDSLETSSSVIDSPDAFNLLVAFKNIKSRDIKKSMVTMAKAIAGSETN